MIAGSLLVSAAATASAQTPVAYGNSDNCRSSLSRNNTWHKLGPTYVETLSVSHVSCGTGLSQVQAYNRCRLAHGGKRGKCTSKVNGYTCKEQRYSSPDQFEATVTCTKSRDTINFIYTQNT